MSEHQFPNREWDLRNDHGNINWEHVPIAVLMDIRSELRKMNQTLSVLQCRNFLAIPRTLRKIATHTSRIKPRAKKVGNR